MSHNPRLFHAPRSYPEPPKDMYYSVPETPPAVEKPKPLFPWEATAPKPTRVFAEDLVSPESEPAPEPSTATTTTTAPNESLAPFEEPGTSVTDPTIEAPSRAEFEPPPFQPSGEPFTAYARTNAWDEVPEIDRYVRALQRSRRGPPPELLPLAGAALSPSSAPSTAPPSTTFPPTNATSASDPDAPDADAKPRRPSMKLTDFPTEIERPSLPVTPAPVRRSSYWDSATGADEDEEGSGVGNGQPRLPGADGVPPPQDWDPLAKLEELRHAQEAVLRREPAVVEVLPEREVVGSSAGMLNQSGDETLNRRSWEMGRESGNGVPVSAPTVSD